MKLSNNKTFFSKSFLLLAFIYFTSIVTTTVSADYFFSISKFSFAGGIFIFPFSFMVGSVIGEVYNYSYQRIVVIFTVICQLLFVIYTNIFIHFTPASFFHFQKSYQQVYSSDFRYFIFAIVGLYFAELTNVYLLTKWKCKSPGSSFIIRAFFCIAFSQLALSIIVNIGAFMGKTGNVGHLINLLLSNYVMKMIITMVVIVPSYILVNKLKKLEDVNYFDVKTKFSPFSIKIDNIYLNKQDENKLHG